MAFTHAITSKKLIFPLAIAYLESHLILRHESGLLLFFFHHGQPVCLQSHCEIPDI